MDLRLLRYFSVLAEELHFGRAATRLNMSQPPLSQQIRLLEGELGTPLFLRTQRRVELTAAGVALKSQAALVFAQMARAVDLTRQAGRGHLGTLEIGMISSVMVGVLPRALRLFQDRHPDVKWTLHEMMPAAQLVALKERRLDLCLFRTAQQDPQLVSEALASEAIAVVLPQLHPLAKRARLRLADLAEQPFISFKLDQSQFAAYLYQSCIEAGFTPRIYQQVVEVQTLLSLVREGLGIGLLPASTVMFPHAGVSYRKLVEPAPSTTLYATYRKQDPSPVLQVFLAIMRGLAEQKAIPPALSLP
ncbi:DNA-binding transcriptional LysR family regulator [Janthinobacterium sp. CG_23.3]|uniref:LysR family transcriptional regulator n=1 Tax=Janthinobacterium sp. CG_23.3 TaxID=3349634 RepID=UPI0038D4DE26